MTGRAQPALVGLERTRAFVREYLLLWEHAAEHDHQDGGGDDGADRPGTVAYIGAPGVL